MNRSIIFDRKSGKPATSTKWLCGMRHERKSLNPIELLQLRTRIPQARVREAAVAADPKNSSDVHQTIAAENLD
jgi:hypothetical protein